jgi:hypothetical protein
MTLADFFSEEVEEKPEPVQVIATQEKAPMEVDNWMDYFAHQLSYIPTKENQITIFLTTDNPFMTESVSVNQDKLPGLEKQLKFHHWISKIPVFTRINKKITKGF